MGPEREQRLVFGDVADVYDRVRPTYPGALADDVIEYGGLQAGDRAVEVGPGTGISTLPFAERGLVITGVEPSEEMAAVARRRLAAYPGVEIVPGLFEDYSGGGDARLVFGGQAWHWVPLDVRYQKAHDVLEAGGTLAYFFNRPDWSGNEDVRAALDAVYDRLAPDISSRGPGSVWTSLSALEEQTMDEIADAHHIDPLREGPLFTDVEVRRHRHEKHYSVADYLDLLRTQSDHRLLEPGALDALLAAVEAELVEHGGGVTLGYQATLYLARAR